MNAVSISRRNFVRGAAAMPFALWLSRNAWATTPLVRYDIGTANGQMMLQVFADAVAKMKLRGETDPLSWLWQWYTHFVNGATTKANEINRIFGTTVTPLSTLAGEMWNTCQSHAGQNANHFLPWHRMFVFFLEQIVREVAQRPDFALPYWNYTSHDPAKRGVLPLQFRLPSDPLFGSLYRANRTSLANSGQPIHLNQPGDAMDIAPAMACPYYHTVNSVPGFCRSVDSGIHGRIHVLVGNSKNMGAVPYAGNDPLFWVHHSNIDRLWASWMLNGGAMPASGTWQNTQFVFVDGLGQRVTGALRDFFSMDVLGYTYDKFVSSTGTEPMAKRSRTTTTTTTTLAAAIGLISERVARGVASAELGDRPVRVGLAPVTTAARQATLALDVTKRRRTYLVLKDLHTWAQPEVLYHLYLTRSQDARLTPKAYVGNINFFDAEFHDHGNGALSDALGDNFYSFDVTELLRSMASSGAAKAGDRLAVTFVPGGTPTAGAKPLVGSIEMFWQ
jgi:tyrosinase